MRRNQTERKFNALRYIINERYKHMENLLSITRKLDGDHTQYMLELIISMQTLQKVLNDINTIQ